MVLSSFHHFLSSSIRVDSFCPMHRSVQGFSDDKKKTTAKLPKWNGLTCSVREKIVITLSRENKTSGISRKNEIPWRSLNKNEEKIKIIQMIVYVLVNAKRRSRPTRETLRCCGIGSSVFFYYIQIISFFSFCWVFPSFPSTSIYTTHYVTWCLNR